MVIISPRLWEVRLFVLLAVYFLGFQTVESQRTFAEEPMKIRELTYEWDFQLSRIVFSPDGSLVAAGELGDIAESYYGPHIVIWEVKSGKTLRRIRLEPWPKSTGQIGALCFSPDGKFLLFSSCFDKTLRVWDIQRNQGVLKISGGRDEFLDATYSPDGRWILSLNEKAISLFDAVKGTRARHFDLPNIELNAPTQHSVAFSPDGKSLVSSGKDGVYLWDVNAGRMIRHLTPPPGPSIEQAVITGDGRSIVAYGSSNEFFVWEEQTGKILRRFGKEAHPWIASFSQDGKLALVDKFSNNWNPKEGLLVVWDTTTGKELYRFRSGSALDHRLALSPNGRRALVVDVVPAKGSPRIVIWDLPR